MKERIDQLLSLNQRPTLSQSLQYSLKILSLNNFELQEYIDEQFIENPFLIKSSFPSFSCGQCAGDSIEKFPSKISVVDDVLKEASFLRLNDFEKEIVEMLIRNNIEHNYLNGDLFKYIFNEKKISYLKLLGIIRKLKETSFASMFAFNLQDKLKTFLENEGIYDNNYEKLINSMDTILSGDWSTLKSRYSFQKDGLLEMISTLKNAFVSFHNSNKEYDVYRRIDLILEEESMDEFKSVINTETLSDIDFDNKLYTESINKCKSTSDKEYIKNNASAAKLLVKSVNSRKYTVLKVANELVYRQKDFFIGKDLYLTPISTKSVANSLFLHESTVNRAILNKTISTPRGIFELRSLMPREMKNNQNNSQNKVSDYSIKEYIKELIKNEPRNAPYSDGHIADFLNAREITISRRTVSKYRDILNIPNISERTKEYKWNKR